MFAFLDDAYEQFRQAFPGTPQFTEENVPDLAGKVYIVTGANTGLGKSLAHILYSKNASVYLTSRSHEKGKQAIEQIREAEPKSSGKLSLLVFDLADLTTIKASADEFLAKEKRLDVLFNNAGVFMPDPDIKTAQGYEMQLGVQNVGTFLFTKLLTPLLVTTARSSPVNSVRVIWLSSSAANNPSGPAYGVDMDNLDFRDDKSSLYKYMHSKGGTCLHAAEFARRHKNDGIVSAAINPGNLKTDLWRNVDWKMRAAFFAICYPAVNGANTLLFAAFSTEVTVERLGHGDWVVPWGRITNNRPGVVTAVKRKSEGGQGTAEEFWDWTEDQVGPFS